MPKYDVTIVVEIKEVEVEATSQEEANQIVLDDAKTRFPPEIVTVTEHSCE